MSERENKKTRSAKKSYKLTPEEESVLIKFMKEHKFMWDLQNKEYKDLAKKNAHWKELSGILNKDGMCIYSVDNLSYYCSKFVIKGSFPSAEL